jgi:L-threonylcarbamoyladenylate synthase
LYIAAYQYSLSAVNQDVRDAAAALVRGQVVCFPTETTYGLAVDIRDRVALARLSRLKTRDESTPFGLIAPSAAHARELAREWPASAAELADRYWPGPLTLIVPARAGLPVEIVGPTGGVGIRVSSHELAAALAIAVGGAITATSANPVGKSPALSVAEARAYFGDAVDVYLDGGPSPATIASTVALIEPDGHVRILRPGATRIEDPDS